MSAHGGRRTARENLADLVDEGSFVEYGRYAIAAQRQRRELSELIERTPADGLIGGTATVNAELFGPERAACAVISYDYTVLAGTQGAIGHKKKDRLFELIERMAPAHGLLRRGRGRATRRHRPRRGLGAGDPGVRALGPALGRGAPDRDRRRPLLRRQRRDRGRLGPDRRDRERLAGDGRARR